jgi:hypothetical protein
LGQPDRFRDLSGGVWIDPIGRKALIGARRAIQFPD